MASRRVRLRARGFSLCPGCGLVLPLHGGPTHAYVGASPGCWWLYCQVLQAVRFAGVGTIVRRLVLDTYALQHPGTPEMRSVQSVAIHAMGLCVLLERGAEERRVVPVLGFRRTRKAPSLYWLDPPCPNGTVGRQRMGRLEPHHNTIRDWLDVT